MNTKEIATEYRISQWTQVMQERIASGESIKEFCEKRGIVRNTYFYWQRKLREVACEQLTSTQANVIPKPLLARRFAEVRVAEPAALPEAHEESQLHVEIGGIQIRVDSTYPPEKLAALLRELSRPC